MQMLGHVCLSSDCLALYPDVGVDRMLNYNEEITRSLEDYAPIGELRVDLLKVSLCILSDNKARYFKPIGFTALLEITKHMVLESPRVF